MRLEVGFLACQEYGSSDINVIGSVGPVASFTAIDWLQRFPGGVRASSKNKQSAKGTFSKRTRRAARLRFHGVVDTRGARKKLKCQPIMANPTRGTDICFATKKKRGNAGGGMCEQRGGSRLAKLQNPATADGPRAPCPRC